MKSKTFLLLLLILAVMTVGPTHAQPSDDRAEVIRQQRRAAAKPTDLLSPGLTVSDTSSVEVLVVNRVAYALDLEIAALDSEGRVLPLGEFRAEPRDHLLIPLSERIRVADSEFDTGSVRVSYLGDAEMIQAWLLTKRGPRVTELQFQSPGSSLANEFLAFWDTSFTAGGKARVFLLNADAAPLTVELTAHAGHQVVSSQRWLLEPGESRSWRPAFAKGWLRLSHDGQPGGLLTAGLIMGPRFLGSLPIFESGAAHEVSPGALSLHSLPVPIRFGLDKGLVLTLFNDSPGTKSTKIEARVPGSHSLLLEETLTLPPYTIYTFPVDETTMALDPRGPQEVRVAVLADTQGILAYGYSRLGTGEVVDLALFAGDLAHDGGIYPLFPLESHETFTNLVNLGSEESTIVAQFWWPGGTYSFGPATIPAGGSYRIDVRDLARRQQPDLLGRTLNPNLQGGLFRWRVHEGSRSLIGRTEIHQRGSRDTFGLNCLNCCYEMPRATVLPGAVEFFPGEAPSFQACVLYDTCLGTEGPFPTIPDTITSPFPFSWNGSQIGASDAAKKNLSFSKMEEGLTLLCTVQEFEITATGEGDTCANLLRKPYEPESLWDPDKLCTQQLDGAPAAQRCSLCQSCCHQILAWRECTREGLLIANSEHQACLLDCITVLGCNS